MSTNADKRNLRWRIGAALVVSALLHLAWWWFSPRKEPEPPPKRPELVQIEIVPTPPPQAGGQGAGTKAPPPAPAPPNGPVTRRQVPPKAPRKPALKPSPAPPSEETPAPEATAQNEAAPQAAPGLSAPPDAPPAVDPSQVNLFAPGALQRSVQGWSDSRPRRAGVGRPSGGGGDPNGLEAEQRRVSGRLDGWLADAQAAGATQAGITGGCDDGIDNNFDGEIDCSDAGCRQLPMCEHTGVYSERVGERLPDGDGRVLVRELLANQEGRIRKLTVRVRMAHGDMRQVNVTLTAPSGERVALHRAHEADTGYRTVFYVRELVGAAAGGRWRLEVEDVKPGLSGRLLAWELYVTS